MIYTVGRKESYREAIAENGSIRKAVGGSVFQSVEDAEDCIQDQGQTGVWIVWGVDADWVQGTQDVPNVSWRALTRPALIIDISSEE